MIFYESFYEALRKLNDADRLAAYDAICGYGCTGEEPEVSGVAEVIFTLVKPQIDANERKAIAGRKGGRPKKKVDEKPEEDQTEADEALPFAEECEKRPEEGKVMEESDSEQEPEPEQPERKRGRPKKEQEPRHHYGTNRKVMLSDTQLEKLKAEFPDSWSAWIERVDSYCQQMGKSYSDYLQTIRNWAKKDQEKKPGGSAYKPKDRFHNFQQRDNDDAGGTGISYDDLEDILINQKH